MQASRDLSDLAGAGLTLTSFEHYPLVDDLGAADTTFSIRIPTNIGDRAIPRSGTLRVRADSTTASTEAVGVQGTLPAPASAAAAFTRGRANAAGEALITLTGGALGSIVDAGARVFLITGAMNGPNKHGFQGEVKSYDFMPVLSAIIEGWLAYTIPAGS